MKYKYEFVRHYAQYVPNYRVDIALKKIYENYIIFNFTS